MHLLTPPQCQEYEIKVLKYASDHQFTQNRQPAFKYEELPGVYSVDDKSWIPLAEYRRWRHQTWSVHADRKQLYESQLAQFDTTEQHTGTSTDRTSSSTDGSGDDGAGGTATGTPEKQPRAADESTSLGISWPVFAAKKRNARCWDSFVIRKEVPSTPAQKKAGGSKTATTTTAAAAATHKGKGKGKETPPAMTFHMECLQCGKVVQQPDTGTSNLTAHMQDCVPAKYQAEVCNQVSNPHTAYGETAGGDVSFHAGLTFADSWEHHYNFALATADEKAPIATEGKPRTRIFVNGLCPGYRPPDDATIKNILYAYMPKRGG